MVAIGPGHRDAGGRDVVEVVFRHLRQLDFVERIHLIILLRHRPRHVRFVHTAGEEERFLLRLAELLDDVTHRLVIRHVRVFAVERAETDAADTVVAVLVLGFLFTLALAVGIILVAPPTLTQVIIPVAEPVQAAVINLARAGDIVAVVLEVQRQRDGAFRDDLPPIVAVAIDATRAGTQARQQRGPRRIAAG